MHLFVYVVVKSIAVSPEYKKLSKEMEDYERELYFAIHLAQDL